MTQHWTWGTHPSEAIPAPTLNAANINLGGIAIGGGVTTATRPAHSEARVPSKMAWDEGPNSTLDSAGGRIESIVGRNIPACDG